MDLGLAGRTALVTGASRGFGRSVALELAAEGVDVALVARGSEDLARTAAEVEAAGPGRVLAQPLDVTDDGALAAFVTRVGSELAPPDLCLINAGGPPPAQFFDLEPDQWEQAYRLMIASAVNLCRLVLPRMIERRWGRIVQITSVSIRQPVDDLVLSNVLRPAVQALAKNISLEIGDCGVTINSVAPGFHLTDRVEQLITGKMAELGCSREQVISTWRQQIPLGRLGEPEELAALVVFLMSQRAGYITGQCIVADGGWVKGTF